MADWFKDIFVQKMADAGNHFPREDLSVNILTAITNTKNMHISCANSCLTAAAKDTNFVGICFFAEDAETIFTDRGRRIRSGYIYIEPATNLTSSGTSHKQTMDKIFSSNLCNRDGVAIVGFAQKNRKLVGRSGTLNGAVKTNLIDNDREMLLLVRTPVFGALIIYKICYAKGKRIQTICTNASSIALMLFLLIRRSDNARVKGRFPNIDIEQADVFFEELYDGLLTNCELKIEQISKMLIELCDKVAAGAIFSDDEHAEMCEKIQTSAKVVSLVGTILSCASLISCIVVWAYTPISLAFLISFILLIIGVKKNRPKLLFAANCILSINVVINALIFVASIVIGIIVPQSFIDHYHSIQSNEKNDLTDVKQEIQIACFVLAFILFIIIASTSYAVFIIHRARKFIIKDLQISSSRGYPMAFIRLPPPYTINPPPTYSDNNDYDTNPPPIYFQQENVAPPAYSDTMSSEDKRPRSFFRSKLLAICYTCDA